MLYIRYQSMELQLVILVIFNTSICIKCIFRIIPSINIYIFLNYLDAKVSNGYSKLANCQLGGSGFQIKTRKRPSRTQKKKSSVHKKENEIEITRNKRCSKNIKTSQCCPQDETTSEGLFALPKVLLNKLYKKVLKLTDYGQLDSSTDEPISRENVNVGPNRISVLNQDVSNGDIKGIFQTCIRMS